MRRLTFTHLGLGAAVTGVIAGTAWAAVELIGLTDRHGHDAQSRAGSALVIADLDGDGHNELLVGAPGYEGGDPPERGSDQNTDSSGDQPDGPTGQVLVYKGSASGPSDDPLIVFHGEGPGDRFGAAIQVGDVTGDGTPDVIVSAILASGHDAPRTGCVYVFSGTDVNNPVNTELGAHDAVAEVCGSQYREHFGRALAVGEFDEHAGLDIAVGAPWYSAAHGHADPGHPYEKYLAGAVYLVSNNEIAEVMADPAHEIHAPLTPGEGWTAAYGENLLSLGDMETTDTPGIDELLIFATGVENHGHSGKGRAYLATWNPTLHDGEPEGFEHPMVVIRGTGTLGSGDPAFLGDLNGDSMSEIGMPSSTGAGTPAAGTDTNSAGGLYIVNGDLMSLTPYVPATETTPESGVHDLGDVSLAAITGELAQDKFGTSMAALGDLDGRGTPDFAIGAPWADGAVDAGGGTLVRSVISGSVYLFSGEDVMAVPPAPADNFKFKIRGPVEAPLLGELIGRSNDRLGEALLSGPLLPSPTTQLVIGAPDREDSWPSLTTDVPGTNSNDNRGTVLIGSPSYVP